MKDYFKAKTWLITILMFIIAFGLSLAIVYYEFGFRQNIKISSASASHNINGWAWSSNIGWVSFNCTNDSPPCVNSNYGVNVDLITGHFSGYAWSSNVGWISFNEIGAPDYVFNANCATAGSCSASNSCTACYNWTDSKVYGWGKIIAMGDNGWIKFNDAWANGVTIDQATNSFLGWAWNANDNESGIGWLSFNCSNDSSCGVSNYKVAADINRPPSVTDMTAPNWSFKDARDNNDALRAKLGWTFSDSDAGQSQYSYQIIVDDDSDPADPLFDSGECFDFNNPVSLPVKCKIDNNNTNEFFINSSDMSLNYDTSYYWWVKVSDDNISHKYSSFTQYNNPQDTPIEADDGLPLTFTTYKHEMPIADFSFFPSNPSQDEEVKFTNESKVYLSSAPSTVIDCTNDQCTYEWTAPGANINDPATTTPIIIFTSAGNFTITLKVTDADGYYVSTSKIININAQLPIWKEVKPD